MLKDKIIKKYKQYGILKLVYRILYWSYRYFLIGIRNYGAYVIWPTMVLLFGRKEFGYKGKKLKLFFHPYNITWNNERMIEIPIIQEELRNRPGEYMEIGNVLQHYTGDKHTVIDLYEKGEGVINQDVVSITGFDEKFNTIVSISTLEHVGWDTAESKDPEKLKRGLESICKCLKPSGSLIFTVPIGYNEFLDKAFKDGNFPETKFFKRTGFFSWTEVHFEEALDCKYGTPLNAANALAVVTINKI